MKKSGENSKKKNGNSYEKVHEIENQIDPLKPRVKIYRKKEENKIKKTDEHKVLEDVEKEKLTEWEPAEAKKNKTEIEPEFLPVEEETELKEKPRKSPDEESILAGECEYKKVCTVLNYTLKRRVSNGKSEKEEKLEEPEKKEKKELITEEKHKKQSDEKEEPEKKIKEKTEIFKEIKSIDNKTAILLYNSGITNIDALREATLHDLTRIRVITKRKAKKILNEFEPETVLVPEGKKPKKTTKKEIKTTGKVKYKKGRKKATKEELELQEKKLKEKTEIFKEIKSIDNKTAILLYDTGITNIDALREATLHDLKKIGIHKRKAIKIIEEVEEQIKEFKPRSIEMGESARGKIAKKDIKNGKKTLKNVNNYISPVEFKTESSSWEPVKPEDIRETEGKKSNKKHENEKVETNLEEHDFKYVTDDDFGRHEAGLIDERINNKKSKIDYTKIFEGVPSIDKKTANLLYENGINSIDKLRNINIRELTKITDMKRKQAKKIKSDLEEFQKETKDSSEENTKVDDEIDEWISYDEDKDIELMSESEVVNGYSYGDYVLYEKKEQVKGKTESVHFFSKVKPVDGKAVDLPEGYEVKIKKRTGIPYLKKIK